MNCNMLISKDIENKCTDVHAKGYHTIGKIMNYSDIDWADFAYKSGSTNIITDLSLLTGKTAYDVVQLGNTPFSGTTSEMVVGTYINTFTHKVSLVVLNNNPTTANEIIEGLANGKFVVVLHSNDEGGWEEGTTARTHDREGAFKVYGVHNGLRMTAGTNDAYSDAFNGWTVELTEEGSPNAATYFYDTDYETSLAWFSAL